MTTQTPGSTLPPAYEPASVESRIYAMWEEAGHFQPKIDPDREPYTIVMPPPNVTGELHLGHGLEDTITDILVRWHRMQGDPTLWLPGEDHAGIATQNVIERELAKEGITRQELGREAAVGDENETDHARILTAARRVQVPDGGSWRSSRAAAARRRSARRGTPTDAGHRCSRRRG